MRLPRFGYRRSPCLVSYWRGEHFVLHNYATAIRVGATPAVVGLIDALDDWRTVGSLAVEFPKYTAVTLSRKLQRLHELSLLQRSDRGVPAIEATLGGWRDWMPEAAFFHLSTKNPQYGDVREDRPATLQEKCQDIPPPPAVKRYQEGTTIDPAAISPRRRIASNAAFPKNMADVCNGLD